MARVKYTPPEWKLARSDRDDTLPLKERLRKIKQLPDQPLPEALHQNTPTGSRIMFSGLLPPEQEIQLRMREVNTLDVAVCKEMKRRKLAGLSTEALRPVTSFLQQRMKVLKYERERLKDPEQPVRYRYLKPGEY